MKARKRPVTVDVLEWTGDNVKEMAIFLGIENLIFDSDKNFYVWTLEGMMEARLGDYIIKGVAGEFYPCKPAIFAQTYEIVNEA